MEIGLGLEVWVSSLVKNAGGRSLRVITTSQGVEVIGDDADAHEATHHEGKAGNPHIWLDPENVLPSCWATSPKPSSTSIPVIRLNFEQTKRPTFNG